MCLTEAMIKIAVIGAGPAGLIAADAAAQQPRAQISIFEKNSRCAKKLLITGKGRCNLTNNCTVADFIPNVVRGGKFLLSALYAFPPEDTMHYFESLGVPLKTERGRRVFPVSDKAADVRNALCDRVSRHSNVKIIHEEVRTLEKNGQGFSVGTSNRKESFDRVILATGGLSYPRTGSTGDGYRLAQSLGHSLIPPLPSLVALICKGTVCSRLEGLSLRNVTLTVKAEKKPVYSEQGELLFTANGISGPLVLSASAHMREFDRFGEYKAQIDLKPALSREQLDTRLLSDFREYQNRDLINALNDLLPQKMIPVLIESSNVDPRKKVNEITKGERTRLLDHLKGFPLSVSSLGPIEEAVVTAGGIPLKEVNPKDMQSKLVPGLYLVGELLDADAYTGGYNLQIAFSTGWAAGTHCTEEING